MFGTDEGAGEREATSITKQNQPLQPQLLQKVMDSQGSHQSLRDLTG